MNVSELLLLMRLFCSTCLILIDVNLCVGYLVVTCRIGILSGFD